MLAKRKLLTWDEIYKSVLMTEIICVEEDKEARKNFMIFLYESNTSKKIMMY
ncbi:hypothetical protein FDUTEX481_05154 [Tolypothrix sp. PCC 7601]|nr:hypothetical protein FDUTEX481_05154 [Tolypothrix sp. PCC 7601]